MASARIVCYKGEWMAARASSILSGLSSKVINERCRKFSPIDWTFVFAPIKSQAEHAKNRVKVGEYRICPNLYNQFMEAFR